MQEDNIIPEAIRSRIVAELRRTVTDLVAADGIPAAHVLAVIAAESIADITALFGGDVAVQVLDWTRNRVRHLPPSRVAADDAAQVVRVLQ